MITVYYASLTVPAGTTSAAPATSTLRVAPGRLKLFRLYVPPGPRGEVSLWLRHQSRQLAPVPPATWDKLDDDLVEFPLDYHLPVNETQLTLYGISPDANFAHTVDFEIQVDTSPGTPQPQSQQSLLGRIGGLFG